MSSGYRNGAFAFGVVVGLGLALNVFVWLDYLAQQQSNRGSSANNGENYSQVGKFWDWLLRTFVSPSDTLAQWIMAVFTIAAVILVWHTLIATQDMVKDTRRIGDAQTRAYVGIENASVKLEKGEISYQMTIRNFGQSPAKNVHSLIGWASEPGDFQEIWRNDIGSDYHIGSMPPGNTLINQGRTGGDPNPERSLTPEQFKAVENGEVKFWVFGEITYEFLDGFEAKTSVRAVAVKHRGAWSLNVCDNGNDMT